MVSIIKIVHVAVVIAILLLSLCIGAYDLHVIYGLFPDGHQIMHEVSFFFFWASTIDVKNNPYKGLRRFFVMNLVTFQGTR